MSSQFSVLMCVYKNDNLEMFKMALNSVLSQTKAPSEIIIAVDGPVPADIEMFLKKTASENNIIKNIFMPVNRGRGAACGEVMGKCSFPLVASADADDINLPYRFEKLLSAFEKDDNLAVCGGQIEEVDSVSLKTVAFRTVPLKDEDIKRYLKTRSPFNNASVMMNRDKVISAGGFRAFYLFEDYDLWVRMAAAHLKMANLPDVLVKVRVNSDMYARRGGYKYFKSNLAVQKQMLNSGIISIPVFLFNLCVRFGVQVLMPNFVRKLFYKTVLRGRKYGK